MEALVTTSLWMGRRIIERPRQAGFARRRQDTKRRCDSERDPPTGYRTYPLPAHMEEDLRIMVATRWHAVEMQEDELVVGLPRYFARRRQLRPGEGLDAQTCRQGAASLVADNYPSPADKTSFPSSIIKRDRPACFVLGERDTHQTFDVPRSRATNHGRVESHGIGVTKACASTDKLASL